MNWIARLRHSPVGLALVLLVLAGVAVRVWLAVAYGPAFAGFGDEHEYVTAAAHGVFGDPQKPAGYPIFLALLHAFSSRIELTIAVQHLLGIATALLLFDGVRRCEVPAWLGLVPAAVALLAGLGVILEHSLLGDPLFAFLQALAVWAAIRSVASPAARGALGWAVLAGAAAACSFWVKTVGLSLVVILPLLLLAGRSRAERRRGLRPAAAAALAGVVLAAAYVPVQGIATGYFGYQRQGAWNLYGRVATFVDCARLRAPAGTGFLCPREPVGKRAGENYYQYARAAPAVRRYGGPARAPASANAVLLRFSLAAIAAQPLDYLGAIGHGLTLYVFPHGGEGYTPWGVVTALLDPRGSRSIQPAIGAYYPGARGHAASGATALGTYEADTRIDGPLLLVLLAGALASPWLLRGRARWLAWLLLASSLLPVLAAEAGNGYDARYGYPALAPLAGAAALGLWAGARMFLARGQTGARRARRRRALTWDS
jgi:hypothetical protein